MELYVNGAGFSETGEKRLKFLGGNSYYLGFTSNDLNRVKKKIGNYQRFVVDESEGLKMGVSNGKGKTVIVVKNVVIDFADKNWQVGDLDKDLVYNYLYSSKPTTRLEVMKYLLQLRDTIHLNFFNIELLPRWQQERLGPLFELGGRMNFSKDKIFPLVSVWSTETNARYFQKTGGRKTDDREDFGIYRKGECW